MYNEKMSKEECESESYSTCFLVMSIRVTPRVAQHVSHKPFMTNACNFW